jgi:REP element-mobilizing transposase RayT
VSIPPRNSDPQNVLDTHRTFFVTTKTHMGRRLLQSDCNATLLVDVLRSSVAAKRFQLHDFVIMPDHVHLLLTLSGDITLEKGCSSSRAAPQQMPDNQRLPQLEWNEPNWFGPLLPTALGARFCYSVR